MRPQLQVLPFLPEAGASQTADVSGRWGSSQAEALWRGGPNRPVLASTPRLLGSLAAMCGAAVSARPLEGEAGGTRQPSGCLGRGGEAPAAEELPLRGDYAGGGRAGRGALAAALLSGRV